MAQAKRDFAHAEEPPSQATMNGLVFLRTNPAKKR
jgi:hypothetical protein